MDPALRTNEGFKFQASKVQRINDSLDQNQLCESSPTRIHEGTTYEKIMNLRPRDRSRELSGDMRYQAKSNVEKVIDGIKNRNALASIKTIQVINQKDAHKNINSIYFKKNLNLI